MGGTNSIIDASRTFRALLTTEQVSDEVKQSMLNSSLTDLDLRQALSLETMRELRHRYTHNFAALLYLCVHEIAAMAARRGGELAGGPAAAQGLPAEQLTRFFTALQLLRRLMPVALEDGTTPLHSEAAAAAIRAQCHTSDAAAAAETVTTTPATAGQNASEAPPHTPPPRTAATLQFVQLFFHEGRTCDPADPAARFPALPTPDAPHTPLATALVWSLVECCFIPGLTLTPTAANTTLTNARKDNNATPHYSITHVEVVEEWLWGGGVGSEDPFAALTNTGAAAAGGFGLFRSNAYAATPTSVHHARKEILATLLAVLAGPLFHAAGYRDTTFTEPLLSISTVPLLPTLAVSLLNVILLYNPYGKLPYMSHMIGDEDMIVLAAARVLVALLCYTGIPVLRGTDEAATNNGNNSYAAEASASSAMAGHAHGSPSQTASSAVFGGATASVSGVSAGDVAEGAANTLDADQPHSLEEAEEHKNNTNTNTSNGMSGPRSPPTAPSATGTPPLQLVHSVRKTIHDITLTEGKYIVERLKHIIGLHSYAEHTILPDSQYRFASQDEFMLLLWKLIELSPSVHAQFGASTHTLDYVEPLMRYALEVRRNGRALNQTQIVLFVLLRLSELRAFTVQGNQPFRPITAFPLPKMAAGSTYNDFVVTCLCLLLESKEARLMQLQPSCAVVLSNMAPFITALGPLASTRLVTAFALFASRVLRQERSAAMQDNPNVVMSQESVMLHTCEAIASLLQYQEAGSRYLLAALVDHRQIIQRVRNAFVIAQTRSFTLHTPLPLLIDTLDMAVAVALPLVESTDAGLALRGPALPAAVSASSSTAESNPTGASKAEGGTPHKSDDGAICPETGSPTAPATSLAEVPAVMARLQTVTLVGMLPTPHRIIIKKFQATRLTERWGLMAFWTSLFTHSFSTTFGDAASIKLLHFA